MSDQRTPQGMGPGSGGGGPASVAAAAVDPVRLLRMYWPWIAVAAVFGAAFGFGLYKALQRLKPSWPARITFEVKGKPGGITDEGDIGTEDFERYIENQAHLMESDQILLEVIKRGNRTAQTTWIEAFQEGAGVNPTEALKDLRDKVNASPIPDTSFVRLVVTTPVRDDAFEIAQDVAQYYLVDNKEQATANYDTLQKTVQDRLRVLRQDLGNRELAVKTKLEDNELSTLQLHETQTYQQMEGVNLQLLQLQQQFTFLNETYEDYNKRRAQLGGMVFPESVIQQARSSAIALRLEAGIDQMKAERQAMLETVGENHRQVRMMSERIRAQEATRERRIQEDMVRIFDAEFQSVENSLNGLAASIKAATERLEQLQGDLQSIQVVINEVQTLEAEKRRLLNAIDEFEARNSELLVLKERAERVRQVGAEPPDSMSFPRQLPTVAAGFLLVVGSVCGFIFVRELREQRIRSPQDVTLVPRTRLLGVLTDVAMDPASPARVETALSDAPTSATAEAVRQLRTALLRACAAGEHRTVLFASGEGGSGTTTVVSNLACAVAALDAKVLVVDANLRRPRQHEVFGVDEGPGLSEALAGSSGFGEVVVASPTCPGVNVLPAGRERTSNLDRLSTRAMSELLEQAKSEYDLVLVDAPPATVSTEALSLANRCDASVIIVRAFQEKRGLLARLRHQFGEARAEFLGVVLNAAQPVAGGYLAENIKATHGYGGKPGGGKKKAA